MHIHCLFYCNNINVFGIDFRTVNKGNPGVGGTEFQIFRLAYLFLSKGAKITIASPTQFLHKDSQFHYIECPLNEVPVLCNNEGCDIAFFRNLSIPEKPVDCRTKFVTIWHNEPSFDDRKRVATCGADGFIFLTRQGLRKFSSFKALRKNSFVCPLLPAPEYKDMPLRNRVGHNVCFVGSIIPEKGLDILCEAWRLVFKACPDARLWIIGSSSLYTKQSEGESKYEMQIRSLLNGIEQSVVFFGKKTGWEIDELLTQVAVGVPKPIDLPETFCLVAVDFERNGIPVVTRKRSSFREVVPDNAGIRFGGGPKRLAKAIIDLLLKRDLATRFGRNGFLFYQKRFTTDTVFPRWENAIMSIINGRRGPSYIRRIDIIQSRFIEFFFHVKRRLRLILTRTAHE